MKVRNSLMIAIFVLAVSTSFAKSNGRGIPAFYKLDGVCIGSSTVQTACATWATGPVCTVVSSPTSTAYAVEMPVCTAVLHQL